MIQEVPFNHIRMVGRELEYVNRAIISGKLSGPGIYSRRCEDLIRASTGGRAAFVVPSCSAALEMSAFLIDINAGDEVIMPSFTFVSTANAVVLRGGVPVFVDVDPITFNIEPAAIEAAITPRSKAITVVHYAGVPADMPAIQAIADRHGLDVVEDAAQALGSFRDGRAAGSFGRLACFSFHGTKNIVAGEAGALVINDPALVGRAEILREKGTDRAQFLAGKVDRYSWQDVGSSQIVSELTTAFLAAQLEQASELQSRRHLLWANYREQLGDAAADGCFTLPQPPESVEHNAHIFFLVLPDQGARSDLIDFLGARQISALTHYVPLHSAPAGIKYGRVSGSMEQTNRVADCLLRLPLYNGLEQHQDRVIGAVLDWARSWNPRS